MLVLRMRDGRREPMARLALGAVPDNCDRRHVLGSSDEITLGGMNVEETKLLRALLPIDLHQRVPESDYDPNLPEVHDVVDGGERLGPLLRGDESGNGR